MRREDYVFCIGFEGSAAIVDGRLRMRYRSSSTHQLAEHGLFKQALCSALHSGKAEELQDVFTLYNGRTEHPVSSIEELMRMFGTFGLPEGVTKTIII